MTNVIENDQQRANTVHWILRFRQQLWEMKRENYPDDHPLVWMARIDSIKSMIDDLEEQLRIYDEQKGEEA